MEDTMPELLPPLVIETGLPIAHFSYDCAMAHYYSEYAVILVLLTS